MTPSEDLNTSWELLYKHHQRFTENVIAIDRPTGRCVAMDLGLPQEAKVGLIGYGWLNTIPGNTAARLMAWLATDDYGPFTYIGWSPWPCHPIPTDVRISLVRQNVGPVAVCVAAYSPLTRSPWREPVKQRHPPV